MTIVVYKNDGQSSNFPSNNVVPEEGVVADGVPRQLHDSPSDKDSRVECSRTKENRDTYGPWMIVNK